jgi:SAM-dependent methyltransferase
MASKQTLFRIFYRIGFTPWDGHPLAQRLRDLVEGSNDTSALPVGSALDLGCGTGDASIYLARHGWKVTAVDFVANALEKARAKARAAGVAIDFVRADVTQLSHAGIGADFPLIVDNGCLHNMSDDDRDAYVRGQRPRGTRRTAVGGRVRSRRQVRRAGHRARRDGATIRGHLDDVVRQ